MSTLKVYAILALSVLVVAGLVGSFAITLKAKDELATARETIKALTLEVATLRGNVDSANHAAETCSASIEALRANGEASAIAARVALEQAQADLDRLRLQLSQAQATPLPDTCPEAVATMARAMQEALTP